MRDIKFRVWNPTNNRMIKIGDKSNDTALWIDENGFYVLDHFAGFPQPIADHLDGLILMQYTGLKDKNGVEIYENDLVQSDKGILFKISWSERRCQFCAKRKNPYKNANREHLYQSMIWVIENCKVVGNIHENQ